jgi:hypothetical protein
VQTDPRTDKTVSRCVTADGAAYCRRSHPAEGSGEGLDWRTVGELLGALAALVAILGAAAGVVRAALHRRATRASELVWLGADADGGTGPFVALRESGAPVRRIESTAGAGPARALIYDLPRPVDAHLGDAIAAFSDARRRGFDGALVVYVDRANRYELEEAIKGVGTALQEAVGGASTPDQVTWAVDAAEDTMLRQSRSAMR